jgi:hypothetical protein
MKYMMRLFAYQDRLRILNPGAKILLTVSLIFFVNNVNLFPIPSYARQTGLSCSACHLAFPQLNSFGRQFKLMAYSLITEGTIGEKSEGGKQKLRLPKISSFSAMAQLSWSSLNKEIPGTQNNNVEFPQQMSMFFSGSVTPRIGTFIQFTYDQQGAAFGIDNIDIRYANQAKLASKELIFGFSVNNNPTVQDVWNTIPAWGYPYASSEVAPTPTAATLVEGGLAQQVAGAGAYALFSNLVYGEISFYRSAPQGAPDPPGQDAEMIVKGVVPYWRVALQRQWSVNYLEVGTFGLTGRLYPSGVSGLTDYYTDLGFDMQYEHSLSRKNIVIHASWIHEMQNLDASHEAGDAQNIKNKLNSFKIDGNLFFSKGFCLTAGYFLLKGTSDMALYAPDPIDGSRTGIPDSDGWILQASCIPWLNTHFSVQYVVNNRFNGAKSNYDNFGRSASSNNTLYLLTWISF